MGVVGLDPAALGLIPANMPYDMTSLFEQMTTQQREVIAFPVREYWLDIGHRDDFELATGDFARIFESE